MSAPVSGLRRRLHRARRLAVVLFALGATVPAPGVAATVGDLVIRAEGTWKLGCKVGADFASCTNGSTPLWTMEVKPGSGPVSVLDTAVTPRALPLDGPSMSWMLDLQQLACGDPKGMEAFVAQVGALQKVASLGPTVIGTCSVSGGLSGGLTSAFLYRVTSSQLPQPTPSPDPPTPAPTATPAPPTTAPSRLPQPSPSGPAPVTPGPTTTLSPASSAAGSPTADGSGRPSQSPSPSADDGSGAGSVLATPAPSGGVAGVSGTPPPGDRPSFTGSVIPTGDVNTAPGAIAGSLLLALLLLLIVGFAGELFNNTVESNYGVIAGWFGGGPLRRLVGGGGRLVAGRLGVPAFVGLAALISCFVDPAFGIDVPSIARFAGMFVGLVVVLAAFKLPSMLARRRATGELGRLRPLPWALAVAVVFVAVSRLADLQPGYLYGIVLGVFFVKDVSPREEGRETLVGSLCTLGAALAGWLGLTWINGLGTDPADLGATLVATACAAVAVAGLEATAFGLVPLRFMPGFAVYRWNRGAWATLWAVSLFGFVHVLIGPASGYVAELSVEGFVAALGVFAAVGAVSIATWLYFRLRPAAAEA